MCVDVKLVYEKFEISIQNTELMLVIIEGILPDALHTEKSKLVRVAEE